MFLRERGDFTPAIDVQGGRLGGLLGAETLVSAAGTQRGWAGSLRAMANQMTAQTVAGRHSRKKVHCQPKCWMRKPVRILNPEDCGRIAEHHDGGGAGALGASEPARE